MSKYTAQFRNINDILYSIEIETEKGSKTDTFLLSGDPLNSSTDSDGKTMFAPIKCSGMTVSILTKDMPFDLYSGSAMGTKVNVKENNKYIFKGFLTPCAYSMGFDRELEEIQLECVDGISVLKEIPYTSTDKEIKPFINIIFNCLKKSNCFKSLYITNNMQFSENANEAIFEKIRVSESNFFKEKDYEMQPDNEVAFSCYNILYEIMQYMGCTLIAEGEDVYVIDYDAIRNGRNIYFKYNISGSTLGTKQQVTLNHTYHIKEGSYAETGNKIDLSETFNKLTVKDSFYNLESVVDGINDSMNWVNITSPVDATLLSWMGTGRYLENCIFTRKNGKGEDESFFIALIKNWADRIYFVLGKFFNNPLIKTYHYIDANNSLESESKWISDIKYSNLFTDAKGAICVGLYTQDINTDTYNNWHRKFYNDNRPAQYIWNSFDDERKLEEFGKLACLAKIENKKLINYILCLNYDKNHIEHDKVTNYPYFTITKNIPSLFGGENGYIILQGSLIRHDEPQTPFPMGHKDEVRRKNTSIYAGEAYFWASLKWGDKYWEQPYSYGTLGGKWVDTPTDFKIYYGNNDVEQKANNFFDQELPFFNTAAKIWGLDNENGFYVPAPEGQNLEGKIELTVYCNKDTKGKKDVTGKDKKNSYDTYKPKVVLFKNLDIKVCFADEAMNDDAAKEDTCYTNEVEDFLNINEGEEIECKICTFDNKTPSLSTTDYLDSSDNSQFIDKLYSKGTNITLRPEEHIIYKVINQYQEPRVIFTANLKNNIGFFPYSLLTDKTLSGKSFVIDTIQRNYRYNKAEVKMIEKNNKYK